MPTKVLVFESDIVFAGELRSELGSSDARPRWWTTETWACSRPPRSKPDLILLSIELPRMNGFSVCNKLKKDPSAQGRPAHHHVERVERRDVRAAQEAADPRRRLRPQAGRVRRAPAAHPGVRPPRVASSARPRRTAAIVIDDEIEVGATDYLLDDDDNSQTMVVSSRAGGRAPGRKAEKVDADVDAFAESAFGRMTGPDAGRRSGASRADAQRLDGVRAAGGGTSALQALRVARRSRRAPARVGRPGRARTACGRRRCSRASTRSSSTRRAKSSRAPRSASARTSARSRRRGRRSRSFASRPARPSGWRARIEELKVRLAAGAKTGGISSRDFLDLREGLNKKDKEILTLKEQLSKKDKEIVESQDRALALERGEVRSRRAAPRPRARGRRGAREERGARDRQGPREEGEPRTSARGSRRRAPRARARIGSSTSCERSTPRSARPTR